MTCLRVQMKEQRKVIPGDCDVCGDGPCHENRLLNGEVSQIKPMFVIWQSPLGYELCQVKPNGADETSLYLTIERPTGEFQTIAKREIVSASIDRDKLLDAKIQGEEIEKVLRPAYEAALQAEIQIRYWMTERVKEAMRLAIK